MTETRTKLRAARILAGLTAEEAAKRLGVHPNSLLSWERGDTEPMGMNLLALSRLYKLSPEDLLEEATEVI